MADHPGTNDDFLELPRGVLPSPFQVLEQAGDLLLIKRANMSHPRGYSDKQRQVFERLVEIGQGHVWVVVLWGSSNGPRAIEVFGPDGYQRPKPCESGDVRSWINEWFFRRTSHAS